MRKLVLSIAVALIGFSTGASAQMLEGDQVLENPLLSFGEVAASAAASERAAQAARLEHGTTCDERETVEAGWLAAAGTSNENVLAANTAMMEMRAACQAIADAEADAKLDLQFVERTFAAATSRAVRPLVERVNTIQGGVDVLDGLDQEMAQIAERVTELETMFTLVTRFCQANPNVSLCDASGH